MKSLLKSFFRTLLKSPFFFYGLLYLLAAWGLAYGSGDEASEFWASPGARLWHSFLAFQAVFWLASIANAIPSFTDKTHPIWPSVPQHRVIAVLCTGVAFVLAALPLLIIQATGKPFLTDSQGVATKMAYFRTKLAIMSVGGTLAATFHVFGLFCVYARLVEGFPSNGAAVSPDDIARYQRLRSQVKKFLGSAAVIIGAATLSTGALRNLINSVFAAPDPSRMPAVLVMAYGVYFTMLLAGVYLPIHGALEGVGKKFLEKLGRGLPLENSPTAASSWKAYVEDQQALRTYLGLDGSGLKNLQEGISVLAPLIAGISSLLLETKA